MGENSTRYGGASSVSASGPCVWRVVVLGDTTRVLMAGFVTAPAQIAELLDTWFRSGGWSSIRVEPLSEREKHALFELL